MTSDGSAEEQKRVEKKLPASGPHFRQIFDDIPAFIAITNAAGEVELVNRQVLEYFGKTLEELKSWAASDAVHPDDRPRVIAAWKRSVETGRPYESEHRLRRADGIYRWFLPRALPVRDAAGRICRWHLVETDIENRKRADFSWPLKTDPWK